MNNKNFTHVFLVEQTPEEAFDAIKNVRGWWGKGIEGSTDKLGDEFTYRHKELHYSKQKLVELVPAKKIVWQVMDDAFLKFTQDEGEWRGTQLCFEISKKLNKTEVRFTHVGLVSARECFDDCSNAWGFYVGDSLKGLITEGKGQPDPKEAGQLRQKNNSDSRSEGKRK